MVDELLKEVPIISKHNCQCSNTHVAPVISLIYILGFCTSNIRSQEIIFDIAARASVLHQKALNKLLNILST